MTDDFKNKIERLLDEPDETPVAGAPPDRLRARLSATLSEGLDDAPVAASDVDAASVAAFIDGRLTGDAREKFARALAREPNLRADMESAADLVSSVGENPMQVPKHLMARAAAQFAPEPPRAVETRSRWSFSFADLLPRQRVALAAVAVLAVVLAIPAGMMFKGGGGGEPELSGVSDADLEAARVKACRDKVAKEAEKAKTSNTAAPAAPKTADGSKPKDPCDPAELKRDGAKKK
jgi:anti-sigma-K factor RskA